MSACKSCGAQIVWATTEHGRKMPVDAQAHGEGNVELVRTPDGVLATVHPQRPLGAGPMHRSHFVTCPAAAEHRRPRTHARTHRG